MTTAQLKKEEQVIKRASVAFKNDKQKARKFLITIGLVDKKLKSKVVVKKV